VSNSGAGATLNGTVDPQGSTTSARFQYSTDPAFPLTVATTLGSGFRNPTGVAEGAAGDVFVADYGNNRVVELSPPAVAATASRRPALLATPPRLRADPLYSYRVVASGPGRSVAGPARSCLPLPPPARPSSAPAANSAAGATLNGTVNPQGSTTSARFQYST